MSRAVRITPEQYLALGDLGVPVYAKPTKEEDATVFQIISFDDSKNSRSGRELYSTQIDWTYWTLVDG